MVSRSSSNKACLNLQISRGTLECYKSVNAAHQRTADAISIGPRRHRHANHGTASHANPGNRALSSDDAIRFVADITALTIFELAERLDGNADKTGALSYRFAAAEGEEVRLPAEVLSAITGWLSAPKDRNPLAGKTSHPYPFDFYGAKDYA